MEDKSTIKRFQGAQESLVVQQSDFSLRTITEMVENSSIDIAPHYQRRERWSISKQSALIESFILNVPVPPIYLSEDEYGIYSVIDGKQRITSITNFLTNRFKLKDLQKFPELNGLYFSDLPRTIVNALVVRPYIRVVTLLRQSDPNLKFEVFLRLNTGGEKLKSQEIRNVAYSGALNDLLYELSENPILREKLKITNDKSTAYSNMDDLELVLRFFTLFETWQEVGGVLSNEMDKYMLENRHPSEAKIEYLRSNFLNSINECVRIWGENAFYKPTNGGWRAQLISPLFDAQMVAVSILINQNGIQRINYPEVVQERTRELFELDFEFVKAVSQATNNPANIKFRISRVYEMLNNLIS